MWTPILDALTVSRLLQQKLVIQIYGHNIFLPSYESPFYGGKYLAANDSHTLFGGFATLTWMPSSVELEEVNLLDQC